MRSDIVFDHGMLLRDIRLQYAVQQAVGDPPLLVANDQPVPAIIAIDDQGHLAAQFKHLAGAFRIRPGVEILDRLTRLQSVWNAISTSHGGRSEFFPILFAAGLRFGVGLGARRRRA